MPPRTPRPVRLARPAFARPAFARSAFARSAPVLAALAGLALGGCLQSDQTLPFELEEGAAVSRTIGPLGGTISLSSGVALVFPVGALRNGTQITLTPRLDAAFPGDAGRIIPGTVFDVAPAGLQLLIPARIMLRLPVRNLPAADAVRLGVAWAAGGRATALGSGSYDGTSGLLTASLSTLGPVAAVVAEDAIPVGTGVPPTLGGGTFGSGSPVAPWGVGVGSDGASAEGPLLAGEALRFTASCNPEGRRCFSSGMVQFFASPELEARLGGTLAVLSLRLEDELTFAGVDANGLPTQAMGRVSVKGTLRAQLGTGVSSYAIDETFITGTEGSTPQTTVVRFNGNQMILSRTTDGNDRSMQYSNVPIGTGRLLTLRVEEEVELENENGTVTKGTVIVLARLRG